MKYKNIVQVNGFDMNVYIQGSGRKTIVFLAGSGVTSPVLEYKPLYDKLSDTFRIAVLEKLGYGFSQANTGSSRNIASMVNESREALAKAGVKPPYILAAHSYSGLEAIYWANSFPEEIEAILGLDMVTPNYALAQASELSEEKKCAMLVKQEKMFRKLVKSRFLQALLKNKTVNASGLWNSGVLNEEEKGIYKELFYKNLCNGEIFTEQRAATGNAKITAQTGKMRVPGHMFISNMKTPLKNTTWLAENTAFAKENGFGYDTADGHFMYVKAPDKIASVWKNFLKSL